MTQKTALCKIHPTAIVESSVELGRGVEVGPYSVIREGVVVGDETKIGSHVVIEGHTTIGSENEIFTGAVIGSVTQDKKYAGGVSFLKIGNKNHIREYATVNPGTKEGAETVIGDGNLLMAYCHVAHDCIVGNGTVLANVATLAGHVTVEDKAIIGGLSAVHQFVRIGTLSIVGGCSKVVQDIPPYMMTDGHPVRAYGLNVVGLERAGVPKEDKILLKRAFKIIFRSELSVKTAIRRIEAELEHTPTIVRLLEFLRHSERGICG
ncbi:MAG: acyl-ACP--UDP-N-acetylglucosamine O-acyltransferase [Candidatus Omnitrophica bacterium]|nr:acyl-ACP--UDP-N-acetylglucosamine O-acyltransferase [Candidatus Omnitrophota bacterium]